MTSQPDAQTIYTQTPPKTPGYYWMKWSSDAAPEVFQLIAPGHAVTIGSDGTWGAQEGSALFGPRIEPPQEA